MTNQSASTPTSSPARIYVLWHPEFKLGHPLARRIYHWFRLEGVEGIPVFFRSANEPGKTTPLGIPPDCQRNYLIPLVEAHMVASPDWRAYIAGLMPQPTATAQDESAEPPSPSTNRLLPVALDPSAYQMPAVMRKLNFIRHNLLSDPPPDTEVLLSRLTEVLCRDLGECLRHRPDADGREVPPEKLKIFLSHAKADGIDTPIQLKEYIQNQTQCEAFFDESDIAVGYNYEEVLQTAISQDSAGLIVVQGDNYADRPWCRKEIRDFLKPIKDSEPANAPAYFIPPVVVVQNMVGRKLARTIPELGHTPCLQWAPGAERLIVTTLIREALLGLFYRIIARQFTAVEQEVPTVYLNREPDPVSVQRVLAELGDTPCQRIVHPGYGLSRMDRDGLRAAFPGLEFRSFAEIGPDRVAANPEETTKRDLAGKVLAVSVGNATDILVSGAGDEHNKELLLRLLRPLFRRQVSVLYGGAPPGELADATPWERDLNFTSLLLYLVLSERESNDGSTSRLYNLSAWPNSNAIGNSLVAQWTDVCSFVRVTQEESGIRSSLQLDLFDKAAPTPQQIINQALCLTAMRKRAVRTIRCTLPDPPQEGEQTLAFQTLAHIFLGGRTAYASGIIPGVLEEILYALDDHKPVFLIGAGMGATGLVARWLADPPTQRPRELTPEHYSGEPRFAVVRAALQKLRGAPETADSALARLWAHVERGGRPGELAALMHNRLSEEDNRRLLISRNYAEIVEIVHRGIAVLNTAS